MPTANCVSSSTPWCNKTLPLLLPFNSLKKRFTIESCYKNNNRDCFLSTRWVYVEWLVCTPQKFLAHNSTAYVKPRSSKLGKWIYSSESGMSCRGYPFQVHSTCTLHGGCGRMAWFVRSFFPPSFLFQLVGVEWVSEWVWCVCAFVCLCWGWWGLTLNCKRQSYSLFSTACQGLENCMLC